MSPSGQLSGLQAQWAVRAGGRGEDFPEEEEEEVLAALAEEASVAEAPGEAGKP